jgi:hypothetical protein
VHAEEDAILLINRILRGVHINLAIRSLELVDASYFP